MNSLAALDSFRSTGLARALRAEPLGFVDVGALGGVHESVDPIAGLVHALCIEPDGEGFEALKARYASQALYAGVSLERVALAGEAARDRSLHVCAVPTNSSLLEPNPAFIDRYGAANFKRARTAKVDTATLDEVVFSGMHTARFGEFLKIDTQGSEYEVLQGARRVLSERCMAIFCEVEFFQVYREQKILADVTCLLREYGFCLYGLYPHYRSAGTIDRRSLDTEERLMWADAIFFKDPLDDLNTARHFSERQLSVLIVVALALRYYDFALELSARSGIDAEDRKSISASVTTLAQADRERLLAEFERVRQGFRQAADFPMLARFLDTYRRNSSLEHLWTRT